MILLHRSAYIQWCLVFLFFVLFAFAKDINVWPSIENDHTKLQFIFPENPQKNGEYQHKDALFGYPRYSLGSLRAQVIALNSTACSAISLDPSWESPYAFLITRGECNFVTKVRNAQHAGAQAVLITDNKCLCADTECLRLTGDTVCETTLPYMTNDEAAEDITIPSMVIRKSDGDDVVSELNSKKYVMAKLEWGILPSPNGRRVEWNMWHSAWEETSMHVLAQLETIVEQLGNKSKFTPYFVSYNGTKVGCRPDDSVGHVHLPCGNMCLNHGRYCLLDPSPGHDQSTGASGSDVIIENLRRICIWKYATVGEKSGRNGGDSKEESGSNEDGGGMDGLLWWKYVNTFGKECNINEEAFADKHCALKVMKTHDIPKKSIEDCMGPYGMDVDAVNPLLEEEITKKAGLQLLRLPALYVDGVHVRGTIDAYGILNAICGGYGNGSSDVPEVCKCAGQVQTAAVMECVHQQQQQRKGQAGSGRSGGWFSSRSSTLVMVLVTVSLTIAASLGYVHWKRSQRYMRAQVRSILAEYMPLEDQEEEQVDEEDLAHEGSAFPLHPAARASLKSPRGFAPRRNEVHTFDDADDDL